MNSLSPLSVGWATAAPWSSGLASGSCATAAEEPTATPTCSNASEELFFLFHNHSFTSAGQPTSFTKAQQLPQTVTDRLHASDFIIYICYASLPEDEHGVFLYFWQSTVVACECFMFNKHIYQLRSLLVFPLRVHYLFIGSSSSMWLIFLLSFRDDTRTLQLYIHMNKSWCQRLLRSVRWNFILPPYHLSVSSFIIMASNKMINKTAKRYTC